MKEWFETSWYAIGSYSDKETKFQEILNKKLLSFGTLMVMLHEFFSVFVDILLIGGTKK